MPTPTSSGLVGNALGVVRSLASENESLASLLALRGFLERLAGVDSGLASSVALFDMADPSVAQFEFSPLKCTRRAK